MNIFRTRGFSTVSLGVFDQKTGGRVKRFEPPTSYPDVNVVLQDFAAHIRSILGNQFLGLYLYGSLALGDFDPHTSDIDFIVVTDVDVSDDSFNALREMHAQFDSSISPWSGKIEAVYIPQEALNHTVPSSTVYSQVEKGTALFRAPLEIGWAFQRHTLREHGVIVTGRDLSTIIKPVDPADMRHAASVIARGWLEQSCRDSSWRAWAHLRSNQAFVVLTLCRFLYNLETGKVTSKLAAARWSQKNHKAARDDLIERSLAGQHGNQETSDDDFDNMLTLLTYTVTQSEK